MKLPAVTWQPETSTNPTPLPCAGEFFLHKTPPLLNERWCMWRQVVFTRPSSYLAYPAWQSE